MSTYTTELRYICESCAGLDSSKGYADVEQIIEAARPKIFNFQYPKYDGLDAKRLETAILKAYYTREIGSETYGLWKLRLDQRMNRIMPYFNQLYESADLKFNPLHNVNYTEKVDGKNDGTRSNDNTITRGKGSKDTVTHSGNTKDQWSGNIKETTNDNGNATDQNSGSITDTTTTTAKRKFSDTPQGGLSGLENDQYMSEAEIANNSDTKRTERGDSVTRTYNNNGGRTTERGDGVTHTFNDTVETARSGADTDTENLSMQEQFLQDTTRHIYGKMGGESYAKLIQEYRNMILNIDAMVVDELADLFMMIY